jgi:hypothetical protein
MTASQQQQPRQDHAGAGAAAAGGDHPVEHPLAEQQDGGKADPVDRLDGQDDQQLAGPAAQTSWTASRHSLGSRRSDRSTCGDS